MRAVIDGIVFETQAQGGISRIYREILPRMCSLDTTLELDLLTMRRSRGMVPEEDCIDHLTASRLVHYLRPWRAWGPFVTRLIRSPLNLGRGHGVIWHSTYYTTPLYWEGPQVVLVADMIHELFQEEYYDTRRFDRFRARKAHCVAQADAVITISETTRHDVLDILGPLRAEVHPVHLAPSPEFRVLAPEEIDFQPAVGRPYLLYVGSRRHYKNFGTVARAYAAWSRRKDVRLVVVGPPWTDEEETLLQRLRIADDVTLLSDVSDGQLCQLYNRAGAFLYPSRYEGFGIPLLEAAACGCPVIASRIPSTEEVAGDYPFYFEPLSVDSLIAALDSHYGDDDPSRRQSGVALAASYSWDATAQDVLDVYASIDLDRRRPRFNLGA